MLVFAHRTCSSLLGTQACRISAQDAANVVKSTG
jgi:hypothetical protein